MSNKNSSSDEHRQSNSTPVFAVAIGASEGGEQAVKELVDSLPADSGMAFVYIQANLQDAPAHLIPALREVSKIPIAVADEPVQVKADHFYIIPADRQVEFRDGSIVPLLKNKPIVSPINKAFSSLSENWKELAIGVLLSGNEIDGVVGLKNIKFEGGLTFAQDSTAEYQSMPSTAVSEGAADVALPLKKLHLN
jgi:two-component system CheB/CheR fusion protein